MVFARIVCPFALVLLSSFSAEALECFSCTNVPYLADCNNITTCPTGSICFADYSTTGGFRYHTLGCKPKSTCPMSATATSTVNTTTPATPNIVGRAAAATCSECCGTGLCNRRLCQHQYAGCKDTTDCSLIGSFSNICVDVGHIKNVCKRFCGLCSLVDGAWSDWTPWPSCSASCGNATVTRTRMCDNPAPVNGGEVCTGDKVESRNCTSSTACPVSGGWSPWSAWGTCSASCDIGIQSKGRGCSNPPPSGGGAYCVGAASDSRLCFPGACADGGWSGWGNWSDCSVSCDGGLTTRHRTCDNPPPSLTGRYCEGDHKESEICNNEACVKTVAFTAKQLAQTVLHTGDGLVYPHTTLNVGGGYDTSTGVFTAPVAGTYQFNVHVCSVSSDWIGVCIMANGATIGSVDYFEKDENDGSCASGTALAVLHKGDTAWIKAMFDIKAHDDEYNWNSFSGVLIGP